MAAIIVLDNIYKMDNIPTNDRDLNQATTRAASTSANHITYLARTSTYT